MAKKANSRIGGIILLVVGVVLIARGLHEYGAFGGRLGRVIEGDISMRHLALFIGGGVCAALGIGKLR